MGTDASMHLFGKLREPRDPDSSATSPVAGADVEVRLHDGRRIQGLLVDDFRLDRPLRLADANGHEQVLQPRELQTVTWREAHAETLAGGLTFELRLVDGRILSGGLRSLETRSQGVFLRGASGGEDLLIFIARAAVASLAVSPGAAAAPSEGAALPALASPPRTLVPAIPLRQMQRPGEVIVLRNLANVQHYLEMLAGQHADSSLGAVSVDSLRARNDPALGLYEQATRLGLPVLALEDFPLPLPVTSGLPVATLRSLGVAPILAANDMLVVAMSNPADRELTALGFLTSHRIVPVLASPKAIHLAFSHTYDRVEDEALVRELGLDAVRAGAEVVQVEAERLARERPVVKMVADIINEAIHRRASDIHIRPGADAVELLYRIDGELLPARRFLRPLLPALVSRIKVMGGMNIAEHRTPQDGRVSVSEGNATIDLRISMLPTVHGEAVVLRLLNTREGLRKLDEIGFSPADQQRFSDLLLRGHGMILATGPTGCGKSTTLYSALLEIRKQNLNIITVEDPVEYRIADIEQIQVNRAAGTTFATTLRNILRHDPDVIMVGEIRDRETAEIAVESALTGHLVLSTLHTSSAATSVTRLLDLGIEPFLLRSTVLAALAQRLARRNCPHCLVSERGDAHMREVLGCGDAEEFKIGAGCAACEGTGVHGRVAVYELLQVDAGIRRLIQKGADAESIHALGIKNGMRPITEHALALARAGTIPLSEAFRIRVE